MKTVSWSQIQDPTSWTVNHAIAERHAIAEAHRVRMRRWRPTLADLFLRGTKTGKQPSATKRGPGRRHKQGHPKLQRRRRIEWALRDLVTGSGGAA